MLIAYQFDIESYFDNDNNLNILAQNDVSDDDDVIDENNHQIQLNIEHSSMLIFQIGS
jgi:hypothetical protein